VLFSSRGMGLILGLMEIFDFDITNPHVDLVELSTQVGAGGLFVPCHVVPRVFSKVRVDVMMEDELTIGFLGQVVNPSASGFFMVFEPGQDLSVLSIAIELALEEKTAELVKEDAAVSPVEDAAISDDKEDEPQSGPPYRQEYTSVWQLIDPTLDVPLRRQVGALAVKDRLRLAKQANRPVRNILIRDVEKRVHVSVLKNPKITDDEIFEYTSIPTLSPNALRWVASQPKYARRPKVRMNLIMNPGMPKDTAVKLMATLNADQLRRIMRSPKARESIQRVARKKLMNLGVL
jgi:hypothetical protein